MSRAGPTLFRFVDNTSSGCVGWERRSIMMSPRTERNPVRVACSRLTHSARHDPQYAYAQATPVPKMRATASGAAAAGVVGVLLLLSCGSSQGFVRVPSSPASSLVSAARRPRAPLPTADPKAGGFMAPSQRRGMPLWIKGQPLEEEKVSSDVRSCLCSSHTWGKGKVTSREGDWHTTYFGRFRLGW